MKKTMKSWKEVFGARYGKWFQLILTIDIKEEKDCYILDSKKFKLKIESTNKNLNEAREEFADAFNIVVLDLVNNGTIFNVLEFLGFKKQPLNKIMKDKEEELKISNSKNKDVVGVDIDELMQSPFININRAEPSFKWGAQI